MRRSMTAALVGLALFAFPGCDDDGKAKKDKGGGRNVAEYPVQAGGVAADSLPVADANSNSASSLRDAVVGPAPTADEGTAYRSSAYFDGSHASDIVAGPTPVSAGSRDSWRQVPKVKPNAKVRRVSLDAGGVPSPTAALDIEMPAGDPSQASAGARGGGPVLLAYEAFQKKFYDTVYPVFSRAAWRARPAKFESYRQKPSRVTIHHTDGKQYMDQGEALAYVREVQRMHMNPNDPKHGWDDIGYHFLIDGAGRVYEGRHPDIMGAHAQGANENNIGISMMGDYNRDKPTAAQIESLRNLITFLALKYKANPRAKGFIEPHRHYNNTDCPGPNVVAILGKLSEDVDGETTKIADRIKNGGTSTASTAFVPLVVTQPGA